MASINTYPSTGRYYVRFHYAGVQYKRSLGTTCPLELGLTEIPSTVDEGDFIISGARSRKEKQRKRSPVPTLSKLFSVYPMFVLVAHTGMRRAELLRSEVADLDFAGRMIAIREKKSSRKHGLSFRHVPMTALVEDVLKKYFAEYGTHQLTLNRRSKRGLTCDTADHHFDATLNGSDWENVKGFHVFRHSFCSNAAIEGVDQRMIDEWMGHQTEEMRRRYRHLAPNRQQEAIDSVFQQDKKAG